MTDRLRRAGHGRLSDGALVRWSVAEGRRGRRWRWTVLDGSGLRHAGLVEFDATGRFARLELETARGMLTLHPDASRTEAHGNIVLDTEVRPLALAWRDDRAVRIDGDPFGSALVRGVGDDDGLVIGRELEVRHGGTGDAARERALATDERGVPLLDGAVEWPLEE